MQPKREPACVKGETGNGVRFMTDGEIAYLTMVMVFFFAFIIVVGKVSMERNDRG